MEEGFGEFVGDSGGSSSSFGVFGESGRSGRDLKGAFGSFGLVQEVPPSLGTAEFPASWRADAQQEGAASRKAKMLLREALGLKEQEKEEEREEEEEEEGEERRCVLTVVEGGRALRAEWRRGEDASVGELALRAGLAHLVDLVLLRDREQLLSLAAPAAALLPARATLVAEPRVSFMLRAMPTLVKKEKRKERRKKKPTCF